MKALGIRRYNVVGYSRGAIIASRVLVLDKRARRGVPGGMGSDFTNPEWPRPKKFYDALMGLPVPAQAGMVKYVKEPGLDTLALASGGDVTQTPGSTITVKNTSASGLVTGSLIVNAGGQITLSEPNDVAVSVTGAAGGTGNNFQFNNVTPLKLQNVNGVASGKVIIEIVSPSPPPPPPPPSGTNSGTTQEALDDVLNSVLKAGDVQQQADEDAEARKAEGEKQEKEQDQKEGRKSCG